MTRHASLISMSVLALATLAGTTFAQDAKPDQGKDVLKGPPVKEGGVPGENRKFTGGKGDRKERMVTQIPHPMFLRAFESIKGDSVDAAVRLSDEQSKKLTAIDASFKDAQKKYKDQHMDEVNKLREDLPKDARRRLDTQLGTRPAKGTPDAEDMDGDKPVDEKKAEAAKARMKELLEGAPKPDEYHAKMWAVLTDAQKPVVQKELDKLTENMKARRDGTGKPGAGKPGEVPANFDGDISKLPPKMQERLKNMTPEEREKALQRLKERYAPGTDKK
ncbi:MAG: hypothetical protein JSR77_03935 [Planctomycetes bacterium]|nr:hypothetical protein [Planctomycetota bacterium]